MATVTLGVPAPSFAGSKQNAQAWLEAKKDRDDAEKVYLEKLKTFQEQNPLTATGRCAPPSSRLSRR